MKGYVTDIEKATLQNSDYRRVLFTGRNTQLVLMSITPGDEIGLETHQEHDQCIRVESGVGTVALDGEQHRLAAGLRSCSSPALSRKKGDELSPSRIFISATGAHKVCSGECWGRRSVRDSGMHDR